MIFEELPHQFFPESAPAEAPVDEVAPCEPDNDQTYDRFTVYGTDAPYFAEIARRREEVEDALRSHTDEYSVNDIIIDDEQPADL